MTSEHANEQKHRAVQQPCCVADMDAIDQSEGVRSPASEDVVLHADGPGKTQMQATYCVHTDTSLNI